MRMMQTTRTALTTVIAAVALVAGMAFSTPIVAPAQAAAIDEPEGGIVVNVCHEEETVRLIGRHFGRMIVVTGDRAPLLANAAWERIEKTPPITSTLYVVLGVDGIVRLFAVNRGCLRRSMAASFPAFQDIYDNALGAETSPGF